MARYYRKKSKKLLSSNGLKLIIFLDINPSCPGIVNPKVIKCTEGKIIQEK